MDGVFLVTGGTGSFGFAVVEHFLKLGVPEIRVLSRDEKKQDDMRRYFADKRLKFYIGDVRDSSSLTDVMVGVDYVFHAAALKQVPSCEFYPIEAMKTNVLGTENVLNIAISNQVKRVVCLSTDKAVYPINSMGITKAMMEKVMIAKSRLLNNRKTIICGTRYGNVMASRGSVIPLFLEQISRGLPITMTDPKMTRFMMTLSDAVNLVLYAFENGVNGDLFVQKAPAASIETLANALKDLTGNPNHKIKLIGTRHGEKLFETLLSREEMASAEDLGEYFRVSADYRDLNYEKYFVTGEEKISYTTDYNSHNTKQLDINEMKKLLRKLNFINNLEKGEDNNRGN